MAASRAVAKWASVGLATLTLAGCATQQKLPPPGPITMSRAVGIVNGNISRIEGTLRASGAVDGYFTNADGNRRSYHVDGVLFFLAPSYLRFDLKKFGDRQLLFGSNDDVYWVYTKEDDTYHCGEHGAGDDLPPGVPLRPYQIVDALGLTPVDDREPEADSVDFVQRIVEDYQQILFLEYDDSGRLVIEKEYWLDRYPPRLVRRVVFRDADGVIEMESRLDDYRPLSVRGPLLPHVLIADWPRVGSQMRLRVGKWTDVQQVQPGGPQFATPKECEADEQAGRRSGPG